MRKIVDISPRPFEKSSPITGNESSPLPPATTNQGKEAAKTDHKKTGRFRNHGCWDTGDERQIIHGNPVLIRVATTGGVVEIKADDRLAGRCDEVIESIVVSNGVADARSKDRGAAAAEVGCDVHVRARAPHTARKHGKADLGNNFSRLAASDRSQ